jgi:hypothetical protein
MGHADMKGRFNGNSHNGHHNANNSSQCLNIRLDELASARTNFLQFSTQIPFSRWKRIGQQIAGISNASAWWQGDWLAYGQARYPDRYKQAIEETSLDYQTLRNYAWISRRFDKSRRRSTLSFQHHAEVASLPEEEQDKWLDRAEKFGWPRNVLRQYLRINRQASGDQAGRRGKDSLIQVRVPVGQEERWQEAALRMGRPLDEWIVFVLDHAAAALLGSGQNAIVEPEARQLIAVSSA